MIPSFKTYFYQVFLEMPAIINPLDDASASSRKSFINSPIDKLSSAKRIDRVKLYGDEFDVYEHLITTDWIKYFFTLNGERMAMFNGFIRDNDLITQIIEAKKGAYKGQSLMSEIYIKYLLKKYNSIISDSALTPSGFHFWYSNFDKYIKNNFVVNIVEVSYDNNITFIENIKNKNDMKEFYTDNAGRYRFQVSN
jgi:hypothetical protein